MKFSLVSIFCCWIMILQVAFGWDVETPDPDDEVVYKKVDNVELKLHLFKPPGHKSTDKAPSIILFFGGGWTGGTPSQFHAQCRYLADRGMVAAAAEYRVKSRNKTSPQECVKDAKSALRWMKIHAKELGIDPEKIVAGGGSAGGHVAAATALVDNMDEEGEDLTISAAPKALVLFNPVYHNGKEGYGYTKVKKYWKEISPFHNIDKQAPPTIVFFGDLDIHIKKEIALEYDQLMEAQERRCDTHIFKGQAHGFFNYGRHQNKYYNETMQLTDDFLVSLGYLKAKAPKP